MRKTTVEFIYETDKVKALKIYLEQRGTSLEEELCKATEALYQKHVPNDVRKFIEMSDDGKHEPKIKKAKANKSSSAVGRDEGMESNTGNVCDFENN